VNLAAQVAAWMGASECRIERNDCTRLHKLADALRAQEVLDVDGSALSPRVNTDGVAHDTIIPPQTFVVRHDWQAAIGPALDDVGSDFRLPFPHCGFEFRINGRTFINCAMQTDDGELACCGFVEVDGRWICVGNEGRDAEPSRFAWGQIMAICVALDADVAAHEVVRAPVKLNEKRERKGLTRVADHRVVDLARRHRTTPLKTDDSPKSRRRLHFRRGHWRHYEDHKTWIKWTLVGDPDLGFIDHHYTL